MSKQTAVEWLINELDLDNNSYNMKRINQAKKMEREQIYAAHNDGYGCGMYQEGSQFEYYKETYGGDK